MITAEIKRRFDDVLKRQCLYDVASVFSDPEFCDEVPLYSRYKQVEFLFRYGDGNQLLLELSLDYLQRVMSETRLPTKRLVALSVIRDDFDAYIVPYIFVCNGKVKTTMRGIHLEPPTESFARQIEALFKKLTTRISLCVFQDTTTVPGNVRVFIGHKSPPQGFISLAAFVRAVPRHRSVG